MDLICFKFPSLSYYYQAIELGNEVFETNDYEGMFFPQKYALYYDSETYGSEEKFFNSEKDLFEFLSQKFDRPITSFEVIETLKEELEENDGCFIVLNSITNNISRFTPLKNINNKIIISRTLLTLRAGGF